MASITTPLQIEVAAALLQNTGLKPLPAALTQAIITFNATTVISNFIAAVNFYKAQAFATQSTLESLLSIGSGVCPALGNSIPTSPLGTFTYLRSEYLTTPFNATDGSTLDPSGFSNLIEQTAAAYIGNGDAGKFCQGFMGVQGYLSTVNQYIESAANINNYDPTFTNMDNLVTAGVSSINTNLEAFGTDLTNQGQLWDPANMELYGTPAGLLQQISNVSGVRRQAIPGVHESLRASGLTETQIKDLVEDNRVGILNSNGLSQNEFDKLQRVAYNGLTTVSDDALAQVLDILDVTTPNITSMEQLLDPVKMFPLSYATMKTVSPDGPIAIFSPSGSVNSSIAPVVNSYLPTSTGCDELGKIIPPADAVANKAIQVSLQQINNLPNVDLPDLAETILGSVSNPWTPTQEYLANDVVSTSDTIPDYYRAAQDVPVGAALNNTSYWTPTTLGGLSTMAGLPLIQAQTTPVPVSVTDYFETVVATGSGPNGTITTYDVLGLALDSENFATYLGTCTTAINTLQAAGTLITLNTAYTNILLAANDAGVLTQITNANNAITAIAADPQVTILNTAWVPMATNMNLSAKYIQEAGLDYFELQPDVKSAAYSFTQNLAQYGLQTENEGACEYLEAIADTTIIGGQAIIGAMREGRNQQKINAGGLFTTSQVPSNPAITPAPVILPVNT